MQGVIFSCSLFYVHGLYLCGNTSEEIKGRCHLSWMEVFSCSGSRVGLSSEGNRNVEIFCIRHGVYWISFESIFALCYSRRGLEMRFITRGAIAGS